MSKTTEKYARALRATKYAEAMRRYTGRSGKRLDLKAAVVAALDVADIEIAEALEISNRATDETAERRRRSLAKALGLDAEAGWGRITLRAASLSRHAAEAHRCADCGAAFRPGMDVELEHECPTEQPAARRARYASAMALRDGHPAWPVQNEDDERDYLRRADTAEAVADAEQAELRDKLREVTEHRDMILRWNTDTAATAERDEAEIDSLRAEVKRLRAEVKRLRTDMATMLRITATESEIVARRMAEDMGQHAAAGARAVGEHLRRLADEARQPETEARGELPPCGDREHRHMGPCAHYAVEPAPAPTEEPTR